MWPAYMCLCVDVYVVFAGHLCGREGFLPVSVSVRVESRVSAKLKKVFFQLEPGLGPFQLHSSRHDQLHGAAAI